ARRRRARHVRRPDLQPDSAGRRQQREGKRQLHRSVIAHQTGRRIGEALHDAERVYRDLVEVLHSGRGGDVDVGDLALPIEGELDHRAAILVRIELAGWIALARSVDHLLRPHPPDGLFHAVEETGELEAARVQEGPFAFLDSAQIVGHRAPGERTHRTDGLIQGQLQRAQLARRPRRRVRPARPDVGSLAFATGVGARVSFSTRLSFSDRYLVGLSGACSLVGPRETTWPLSSLSCFSAASGRGATGRFGSWGWARLAEDCGPAGRIPCNCDRLEATSDTTWFTECLGAWNIASLAIPSSSRRCTAMDSATAMVRRRPRRTGCWGKGIAGLL